MDALFVNEKGGENRRVRRGLGAEINALAGNVSKRADPHRGPPLDGKRGAFRCILQNEYRKTNFCSCRNGRGTWQPPVKNVNLLN